MGVFKATFLFVLFLFSVRVQGQTLEEMRLNSQSKYNFLNDFNTNTNAQKEGTDQVAAAQYTLGIKYALNPKNSFWFFARVSKSFSGEERLDLLDTILRYERTLGKFSGFNNRLRVSLVLPTNEFVREQTTFLGALALQMRTGRSLTSRLYLNWINTLRLNAHEFRVSEIATANNQALLSSTANLSYRLSSKLLFATSLGWSWAKTYKNIFKDRYLIDASLVYSLTNEWNTYLGAN